MKKLAHHSTVTRPLDAAYRGAAQRVSAKRRTIVLFALPDDSHPTQSLVRAAALSRALCAELRVLRVLPPLRRGQALSPRQNGPRVVRPVRQTLRATRSARTWIRGALGETQTVVEDFTVVHGNFLGEVVQRAASLEAALIVVPSCEHRIGTMVTALASASGVPVLVARDSTNGETILAATDLLTEGYPVLNEAAALGLLLQAPVVAIHNVDPLSVVAIPGPTETWPMHAQRDHEATRARLAAISGDLPVDAKPIIRQEMNPVDAILDEARDRDVDLVVVGTRRRRRFERLLAGNVATQVVNRAKRSVLVTPLDGLGPATVAPVETCRP